MDWHPSGSSYLLPCLLRPRLQRRDSLGRRLPEKRLIKMNQAFDVLLGKILVL
jgi:hypothetical protein